MESNHQPGVGAATGRPVHENSFGRRPMPKSEPVYSAIKPDLDAATRFLSLLDESAERFAFQTFSDSPEAKAKKNGSDPLAQTVTGDFDGLVEQLAQLNRAGAGVFVTTNETDGQGRRKANIKRIRAIWQEDDGQGQHLPLDPHIIVESSPGKYHRYLLVDGLTTEQFGRVMKSMCDRYGSDPNARDLARVLRLPGFYHLKSGTPHLVTIVHESGTQPYSAQEVLDAFGVTADPDPTQTRPQGESPSSTTPNIARARKLAFEAAIRTVDDPQRGRHQEIVLLANVLRRERISLTEEVIQAALETFAANMRPTDTAGNACGMNWEAERRALVDGYNNPTDPDRDRPQYRRQHADSEQTADIGKDDAEAEQVDFPLTEDGLALSFVNANSDLRYVPLRGAWHIWNGHKWVKDEKLSPFTRVRKHIRALAQEDKAFGQLLKKNTVAAVEFLARSDSRVVTAQSSLDADIWALNTPSGIIDLKTGNVRACDKKALCTKSTSVGLSDKRDTWNRFLLDVTDGDEELIGFLKRIAGYSLTGETREHALFFLYGTGGNGKGVFLNTLNGILGDYAAVAPMSTFMDSRMEAHPTDLAMLCGARLVSAQETRQGEAWAEGKLKALTGGDPITARFMRQDFFTYQPQFKLLLSGNHKPALKTVDESVRRRFRIVPFTVTIPDSRKDKNLPEKLRTEYGGILKWALEGCLEWQRNGLNPPQSVLDATDEYLVSMDVFADFINEQCETGPDFWEKFDSLFKRWCVFAKDRNEMPGKRQDLGDGLMRHGYALRRDKLKGRHVAGIRLKPVEQEDAARWGG